MDAANPVEVVRGCWRATYARDMDGLVALWHEDVVYDLRGYAPWAGRQQLYEGQGDALAFLAEFLACWRHYEIRNEELIQYGDRVLALVRHGGRPHGGGPEVREAFAMVWTVRDGLVTRIQSFSDREAAHAAAEGAGAA